MTPADASLDHLFPFTTARSRWDNHERRLVTCCRGCNDRRRSLRLAGWLRRLRAWGHDLREVLERLGRVRRPIDRRAGLAAYRAAGALPARGQDPFTTRSDGVPY